MDILEDDKCLKDIEVHRIVFNEITKDAILNAIQKPRSISTNLVNAQFARRAIDYLYGMGLSPLLWGIGIRKGSAGRVQSPALKMTVEREEEIKKFNPQEYWSINAKLQKEKNIFDLYLFLIKDQQNFVHLQRVILKF